MIRNEEIRTKYTADVTGAVRDLRRLADEQRGVGKSMVEASKSGGQFMALMDKLSKFAAPAAAVAMLKKGFDELAEYQTLSARASTVAVDKIIAGTKGLVTNMDAMRMAAKLAGKVTSEQMEIAAKAAFALSNEGFDLKDTFEKLTQSILKGKAGGLDDLGLKFREAKTEGEQFNAMMETLGAKASEGETATLGTAGSVQKLGVDMQNSMDKIKRSLGEIVIALEPLIAMLADAVGLVAELAGYVAGGKTYKRIDPYAPSPFDAQTYIDDYNSREAAREVTVSPIMLRGARSGAGRGKPRRRRLDPSEQAREMDRMAALLDFGTPWMPADNNLEGRSRMTASGGSASLEELRGTSDVMVDMAKVWGEVDAVSESMIVKMLGPVDEIDGYRVAFEGLTSAVNAAFSAWIDGSTGIADAAKQAVRESIKALALESAQKAVYHTAAGFGALALGPLAGATAASHFKAAALYGAVAVGAGAAARNIGPAGGSGSGAYGGGSGRSGGGAYSGGTTTTVISYGDSFSDDSHRMRQNRARRLVALAGNVSGRDAVRYE